MMPKYIEELVSRQLRRSEIAAKRADENGKECVYPIITISRRMGSGARIIAAQLAEELGWSLWDKDLIDAIAEDADVSRQVVESFDEKARSEIEMVAHAALGDYVVAGFNYPKHLARAVAAIPKPGRSVVLGRGANLLLPDALNIRIDASDERRMRNMMEYENLDRESASLRIRESDRDRANFIYRTFGKERVESFHFDLEIWMDGFSNEAAVDIIKTALCHHCAGAKRKT